MNGSHIVIAALLIGCSEISEPSVPRVDQENLFTGAITSSILGRVSTQAGEQAGDHQIAQTFTVGVSGRITTVRVPLTDVLGTPRPTIGATMDIVAVNQAGVPDESRKLGEASVDPSALLPSSDNFLNPENWAAFNFTGTNIEVTQGEQLAFIIRSASTIAIRHPIEYNSGYSRGAAFHRDRVVTESWTRESYDYLFQTSVASNVRNP